MDVACRPLEAAVRSHITERLRRYINLELIKNLARTNVNNSNDIEIYDVGY